MNKRKRVKEIFNECPMVRDYKFCINGYGNIIAYVGVKNVLEGK